MRTVIVRGIGDIEVDSLGLSLSSSKRKIRIILRPADIAYLAHGLHNVIASKQRDLDDAKNAMLGGK